MRLLALCTLVLIAAIPAAADLVPIQLDGYFDDWSTLAPVFTDAAGDDGTSGIDFGSVWVANDQDYLYVRFETGADVQPDEQQQMRLYLDTDMNAGTGLSYGGIGAELMWEFGYRDGTFTKGGTATVQHDDVGLLMGPTVSSTDFEIALRRDAVPANGQTLFSGDTVRFILRDAASGGDLAPNSGSISYTFSAGSLAVDTLDLGRADPAHIRLATWNVENDGLFAGGTAEQAQNRLLDVMDPDVLVVCEAWNHTAGEVGAIIEQHLPSDQGEDWYAVKLDAGNVVCSRFPILDSWEVNPGYRITAALLDLGPDPAKDLLLIACHWRCCTADAERQEEADSIIEFLADARTPGGLNLVGWRQQLETILTGDIINEGLYGPDSAPDWGALPLVPVIARQADARRADTWWNDGSTYYPGKLDWILYTDSALDLHRNFVLETRTMKPETLALHGLYAGDTTLASDHAALVADFAVFDPASDAPIIPGAARHSRLLPNVPNPFKPATELRFSLEQPGRVELGIYDATGRLVRTFPATAYPAGSHGVRWDGNDGRGRRVASGVYQVLLTVTSQGTVVQEDAAITLIK